MGIARSRNAGAAVALALLLGVSALTAAGADQGLKFNLGVLRRDGVLFPFAAYDGRAWSIPWPGNDLTVPLPISLADVPAKWFGPAGPGATWTAWFADGSTRRLATGRPVQVPVFCGSYLGLTTDYHGADVDPRDPTVPKDALAVTGALEVGPITIVSVLAADAARMVETIADRFNETEREAANRFTDWKHPWSPEERKTFPIQLEALYRANESRPGGKDFRTTYVEAIRKFPARPEDRGCGLITFARGWITEPEGKKPIITLVTRVTYCDRDEVAFMQPLGRVRTDKDSYWVYQISSWRDEVYGLSRVSGEGVRPSVTMSGGGCPKFPRR